MPRPAQGHPVLVQAGSSPTERDYAARYAEAIFTAQHTFGEAVAFYLHDVVSSQGRILTPTRFTAGAGSESTGRGARLRHSVDRMRVSAGSTCRTPGRCPCCRRPRHDARGRRHRVPSRCRLRSRR